MVTEHTRQPSVFTRKLSVMLGKVGHLKKVHCKAAKADKSQKHAKVKSVEDATWEVQRRASVGIR